MILLQSWTAGGKDAIAVDGVGKFPRMAPDTPKECFNLIPMRVADMNFPAWPAITEAIEERTEHPAFGCFDPTDECYNAIIQRQATATE